MATDLTGQTFGSYRLIELLGRGGMASVYRGYQESIDRSVAIKVLPHEFLHDPNFSQRFIAEARTLAKLAHSAILPLYDFGTANEVPYIVMPLMTGGTLSDRMASGALPFAEVARIFTPIADALDYAHSQGVVHRDIKPSNILFDHRGQPFLADFGIAKALEASNQLTGTAIVGTPDYMSPEQARGEPLDGRSDIYSFGVMAYQCLTGDTLFKATTPIAVMLKHATETPPPIRQARRDVPQAIEDALIKCLAKYPSERFQTAGEFMRAFNAPLGGTTTRSAPTAAPATVLEMPPTVQPAFRQPQPTGQARPVDGPTSPPPARAPTVPNVAQPQPAEKKGGLLGILIGGGVGALIAAVAVIVVALFCCVGLYVIGTSATPTPLPTPTAEPTVSPFLFSDDFSDPNSGWEVSTGDVSVLGYSEGEYFIQVIQTGWFVWSNGPSAVYRDVQISVSARQLSTDYSDILFGIMCNFQDNQHYYYMGIDTQGYYGIGKRDGENDTILTGNGQISYSDKLAQGGNWYNLTAACAGGALTLYVDGVLIDSATDSEYAEGNIGLFADVYPPSSGDPNQPMFLEMRYDNLVVAAPP